MNNLRAHSLGLHFEPVGWERVIPSFGRPQALINSELESADLVVVLFWNRIGSPSAAGSELTGTEEEFNLARKKYEDALGRKFDAAAKPLIWVYFRAPTTRTGDQFQALRRFKTTLEAGKDIFFRQYDAPEDWEEMFREHLVAYLDGVKRWDVDAGLDDMKPELALLEGDFLTQGIYEYGTRLSLQGDLDGDGNGETVTFYWSQASFTLTLTKYDLSVYLPIPEDFHQVMEGSGVIQVMLKDVTNDGYPEIIIAADGGVANLHVAVWGGNAQRRSLPLGADSYSLLGVLQGQFRGYIFEGGTIRLPYGSQGLTTDYRWQNGAFSDDSS